jgi:hypothetical protein
MVEKSKPGQATNPLIGLGMLYPGEVCCSVKLYYLIILISRGSPVQSGAPPPNFLGVSIPSRAERHMQVGNSPRPVFLSTAPTSENLPLLRGTPTALAQFDC